MTTVLVIGGYGTFGHRLARLLSEVAGLTVLVAGRSLAKAQASISGIGSAENLIPYTLDRSEPFAPQLNRRVDIVVDAVGPFQAYGETRNFVFDYCAANKATYIDLSDDPSFCQHIMIRAKNAPMTVATGWSTYSAVTGAAAHALGGGVPVSGIVPSPRLPMGRAVIDSVLSYAGQPIPGGYGLTQTLRRTVAPPGVLPMRNMLFSNVATPDAVLIDKDAMGYVAPQPEILHRVLIAMTRWVKAGWLPRLTPFGGVIHRVQRLIRLGEPRGGLFVEANGRRFDLTGEGESGPYVPVIPAAALITALHGGERFASGLLSPGAAFPLARMTPWFNKLGIDYGIADRRGSLYEAALGGAMAKLPKPIRKLHQGGIFAGRAQVTRGRNPLGRLIANLFGLPKAGAHGLNVSIITDAQGCERWSRIYSGHKMFSLQSRGARRADGLIIERFGPVAVQLALSIDGERLRYQTRGWSVLGLPLPRALVPGGDIYEAVDAQGRFTFHVDMIAPGLGRLVRYEGWLAPETADPNTEII